jgi:hypothetical protein
VPFLIILLEIVHAPQAHTRMVENYHNMLSFPPPYWVRDSFPGISHEYFALLATKDENNNIHVILKERSD